MSLQNTINVRAEANEWIASFPNGVVVRVSKSDTKKWPFFNQINAMRNGLKIHLDASFHMKPEFSEKTVKVAKSTKTFEVAKPAKKVAVAAPKKMTIKDSFYRVLTGPDELPVGTIVTDQVGQKLEITRVQQDKKLDWVAFAMRVPQDTRCTCI